ncbi:MAG: hypothetical protein Q7I99_00980, partial [Acholeplasmataceae bacterium]|nr:hypothetical protein [Acholeplasmataceae bacterium]
MKIFVDGFQLVRVETDQYIYKIEIENNHLNWLKNEGFNQFFVCEKPIELHRNDRIWINDLEYPLEIGLVTLSKDFELRFRYDGKLGYEYSLDSTKFSLFSPVAKEVFVVIESIEYPMEYIEPIWTTTVKSNLEGLPYHYKIRLVDQFSDVKDPYTNACS